MNVSVYIVSHFIVFTYGTGCYHHVTSEAVKLPDPALPVDWRMRELGYCCTKRTATIRTTISHKYTKNGL